MTEVPARLTSAPAHTAQLSKAVWVILFFFFLFHPQRHWKYSFTAKGRTRRAKICPAGRAPAARPAMATPSPLPQPAAVPGACAAPPLRTEKMAASALSWALRAARQVSPAPSLPCSPLGPCPARPRRRGAGRAQRGGCGAGQTAGGGGGGGGRGAGWAPAPRQPRAPGVRRRREQGGGRERNFGSFVPAVW